MNSVLKKIGIVLAEVGSDVTKVMGFPFISDLLGAIPGKLGTAVRTGVTDLNLFAQYVSMAEAAYPAIEGAKTGSQKLAAVTPLAEKALIVWAQSNLPGHSKLQVSAQEFSTDAGAFMSAFVKIMNDFGE